MKLLRHAKNTAQNFCAWASEIIHHDDERLTDELVYEIPGFEAEGTVIEAHVASTKDFRFAVTLEISNLWSSERPYPVFWEEVMGTRPAIGETYRTIMENEQKRGYRREPMTCKLRIAILPKKGQEPRFLRTGVVDMVPFCVDGPMQSEVYNNGWQRMFIIDPSLRVPAADTEVRAMSNNVVEIVFCDKSHTLDIDALYKKFDKESFEESKNAIEREGKRVLARVREGLASGTVFGLERIIARELRIEKNPLERNLLRRARKALEPEQKESSRGGGAFIDGDGCYRDAPGWGGHSAG